MDARTSFIDWMSRNRGEDPGFLGMRWDRFQQVIAHHDIWDERDKRAFLLAPPFDRIIVTCGIDHIPPPLLQQLKPGGIMVIPVGRPGAQHVLEIVKQQAADGAMSVVRSDIYNGNPVSFVPFTKLEGDAIKGTHRAN
jgi:protein-L-isoaspartate O-methyltransferase